jgi:hypothetical protein
MAAVPEGAAAISIFVASKNYSRAGIGPLACASGIAASHDC